MPRLVVNPGSAAAWEIQLKPGVNTVGRGFSNDFKLEDPSVSGAHCQITVQGDRVTIKDLGSTNGTFVNHLPVREAMLQPGQTVHVGGLQLMFYSDSAPPATVAPATAYAARPPAAPGPAPAPFRLETPGTVHVPAPTATPAPVRVLKPVATELAATVAAPSPAPVAAPLAARVAAPAPAPVAARVASPIAQAIEESPMAPPPIATPAGPAPMAGSGNCKHHPKNAGRFFCPQCQQYFCELCVTTRTSGGVPKKFCRHCGLECTPVQVQARRPAAPKGFFAQIPGIFIYPFKGSGLLVLFFATLLFAALEYMAGGLSILLMIVAVGYLFSYMQAIIHSTASEDTEMPELPGFDDVFGACFRLLGAFLLAFGMAAGIGIYSFFQEEAPNLPAIVATIAFGCFYFPMALLAVAMKDSVAAANPLVVVSGIFKAPAHYLVAVVLLAAVFGARVAGGIVVTLIASGAYSTRSMSELFIIFGVRALWSFIIVYLLTINMRLLGLFYVCNKHKLGWFNY